MGSKIKTNNLASLAGLAVIALHSHAASAAQTVCTPAWTSSESDNTTALQDAIDTCGKAGTAALPGLVELKADGSTTTAQIRSVTLASNIVLNIAAGFTLRGPNPSDVGYTGKASTSPPNMLGGSGLSNVTINGAGTLDGNGAAYWAIFNKGGSYSKQERQRIIELTGANLKIGANFSDTGVNQAGVTFPTATNATTAALKIKDSPKEQVTIESGSSNIIIDGVWIYAPTGRANLGTGSDKNVAPNTDGIDLIGVNPTGSGTALVQNCLIDTGDDDIAIKSNTTSDPTHNVTVKNCVMGGGHGLSIGGQETGGVVNTVASNIWFKGTDFGFRIKTDNSSKDSGTTNGASYSNSCMLGVGEPILLTYLYNGSSSGGESPTIEAVTFNNIVAVAGATPGQSAILGQITGLADDPLSKNISIINSMITGTDAERFTVTDGTLSLGAKSIVATTADTGGKVTSTSDTGPTIACPSTIEIPEQQ
jgi:polygalacturonase